MIGVAAFLVWATHPLLDALAGDTSVPYGVMAFWPISHQYFQTGLSVFMPIWRYPVSARAITHDLVAIGREIVMLAPVVYLTWRARGSMTPSRGGQWPTKSPAQ
jgi:inner membrane protein